MKLKLISQNETEHGMSRVFTNVQTNGDHIRSMTDKELAEFLRPVKCVDCHLLDCGVEEMDFKKTCEERILDWLKEEVKEE